MPAVYQIPLNGQHGATVKFLRDNSEQRFGDGFPIFGICQFNAEIIEG